LISSGAARAIGVPCRTAEFNDVFEIPIANLRPGQPHMRLSVDLTIGEPVPIMGEIIQQTLFSGSPQIVITLYDFRLPKSP
jgi:hypothetical protein